MTAHTNTLCCCAFRGPGAFSVDAHPLGQVGGVQAGLLVLFVQAEALDLEGGVRSSFSSRYKVVILSISHLSAPDVHEQFAGPDHVGLVCIGVEDGLVSVEEVGREQGLVEPHQGLKRKQKTSFTSVQVCVRAG